MHTPLRNRRFSRVSLIESMTSGSRAHNETECPLAPSTLASAVPQAPPPTTAHLIAASPPAAPAEFPVASAPAPLSRLRAMVRSTFDRNGVPHPDAGGQC